MNLKELKEMVDLMNENGLSEIEVEREGLKVKIKKAVAESVLQAAPVHYQIPTVPSYAPAPAAKPAAESAAAAKAEEAKSNLKEIKSPTVCPISTNGAASGDGAR